MSDGTSKEEAIAGFSRTVLDLARVGPAPRTLGADKRRLLYALPQNRFVMWVILSVLFSMHLPILFSIDEIGLALIAQSMILPAVFVYLAVRAYTVRKEARQRYVEVYENGVLLLGRVGNMQVYRYRNAQRCTIQFVLPQNKVAMLDTWSTSVDLLAPGMEVEVLWYERYPDVVIPTIILPEG